MIWYMLFGLTVIATLAIVLVLLINSKPSYFMPYEDNTIRLPQYVDYTDPGQPNPYLSLTIKDEEAFKKVMLDPAWADVKQQAE